MIAIEFYLSLSFSLRFSRFVSPPPPDLTFFKLINFHFFAIISLFPRLHTFTCAYTRAPRLIRAIESMRGKLRQSEAQLRNSNQVRKPRRFLPGDCIRDANGVRVHDKILLCIKLRMQRNRRERSRSPSRARGQWSLKFERNFQSRLNRELRQRRRSGSVYKRDYCDPQPARRFPLDVIIRTTCLNALFPFFRYLPPRIYISFLLVSPSYLRRPSRSSATGAIFASTVTPAAG